MSEVFNLERNLAEEKLIDPTGKKWEIKGERENGLVHARPNPDRVDAVIPDEFAGRWTSAALLRTKIINWLKKQWDMSEQVAAKNARKAAVTAEHKAQKTAEESLNELPDHIKEALGDTIAVKEEEDASKTVQKEATEEKASAQEGPKANASKVTKKKAAKKKVAK